MKWRSLFKRHLTENTTAGRNDCSHVESLLSLYNDGMVSSAEAAQVEAHLAQCDSCRQANFWMRATCDVLANRPTAVPSPQLSSRIKSALADAAEAERQAAGGAVLSGAGSRPRFVTRPVYAFAAALLVAAIVAASLNRVWTAHNDSAGEFAKILPAVVPGSPPHVASTTGPMGVAVHPVGEQKVASNAAPRVMPEKPHAATPTVNVSSPAVRQLPHTHRMEMMAKAEREDLGSRLRETPSTHREIVTPRSIPAPHLMRATALVAGVPTPVKQSALFASAAHPVPPTVVATVPKTLITPPPVVAPIKPIAPPAAVLQPPTVVATSHVPASPAASASIDNHDVSGSYVRMASVGSGISMLSMIRSHVAQMSTISSSWAHNTAITVKTCGPARTRVGAPEPKVEAPITEGPAQL